MTSKLLNTRIFNKVDSQQNWTKNNPILGSGEIGFDSTSTKIKIGDGKSAWNNLSYLKDEGLPYVEINGQTEIQKNVKFPSIYITDKLIDRDKISLWDNSVTHLSNLSNPHKVTASQTGAYWSGNSNNTNVNWSCKDLTSSGVFYSVTTDRNSTSNKMFQFLNGCVYVGGSDYVHPKDYVFHARNNKGTVIFRGPKIDISNNFSGTFAFSISDSNNAVINAAASGVLNPTGYLAFNPPSGYDNRMTLEGNGTFFTARGTYSTNASSFKFNKPITATSFIKEGSSDQEVLLGGGGTIPLSSISQKDTGWIKLTCTGTFANSDLVVRQIGSQVQIQGILSCGTDIINDPITICVLPSQIDAPYGNYKAAGGATYIGPDKQSYKQSAQWEVVNKNLNLYNIKTMRNHYCSFSYWT